MYVSLFKKCIWSKCVYIYIYSIYKINVIFVYLYIITHIICLHTYMYMYTYILIPIFP